VVNSVGTLKAFAAFARPTTLLTTVWLSWLRSPANWNGWWSIRSSTQFSGVNSAFRPVLE
jgi:hypothetical protein